MTSENLIKIDGVEYHIQHINNEEVRLVPDFLIITVPVELEEIYVKELGLEGKKVMIYKDLFSDSYLKDVLKEAFIEGKDNEVFTYCLVRHGSNSHGFGFYPLPLLFSDEFTRAIVAEENGRSAPPEIWVRRKRKIIMRRLGLGEDDFNPVRKKHVPGVGWVSVRKLFN
jgi:hypothetical protein